MYGHPSGIVWICQGRRIALYFTGCKHAGENLAEVLKQRSPDLPPAIQMCDALSRNMAKVPESLQLCREKLNADPFSGHLFIFRTRRGMASMPFLPSIASIATRIRNCGAI